MGHLDQFAKQTFAEDTEAITGGAVAWGPGPEVGLSEVRADGLFHVLDPSRLASLAMPWSAMTDREDILVELKMQGDHVDARSMQRSLLRRQAWQVKRIEATEPLWLGEVPLWKVAATVPDVIKRIREVQKVADGCYRIGPSSFPFLWMASNELPLREELMPFLITRTGRALVDFLRWAVKRRPRAWSLRMIQELPMPMTVQEEFDRYLAPVQHVDAEMEARGRDLTRMLLRIHPDVRDELIEQGIEQGLKALCHLYERRLGRSLTTEEHKTLSARFTSVGPQRLGDVVLDLSPEALAAWLSDTAAT